MTNEAWAKHFCVRWQDGTYVPDGEMKYRETIVPGSPADKLERDVNIEEATISNNENSPYWNWFSTKSCGTDSEETVQANPDVLQERTVHFSSLTQEQHEMALRAYSLLTKRQREVWDMYMQQGMTETVIGEKLGISHVAVSKLLSRAKAVFVKALRGTEDL